MIFCSDSLKINYRLKAKVLFHCSHGRFFWEQEHLQRSLLHRAHSMAFAGTGWVQFLRIFSFVCNCVNNLMHWCFDFRYSFALVQINSLNSIIALALFSLVDQIEPKIVPARNLLPGGESFSFGERYAWWWGCRVVMGRSKPHVSQLCDLLVDRRCPRSLSLRGDRLWLCCWWFREISRPVMWEIERRSAVLGDVFFGKPVGSRFSRMERCYR